MSKLTECTLAAHDILLWRLHHAIRYMQMRPSTLDAPNAQIIRNHLSLHVIGGLLCLGLRLRLGCPAPIVVSIPGKHGVKAQTTYRQIIQNLSDPANALSSYVHSTKGQAVSEPLTVCTSILP